MATPSWFTNLDGGPAADAVWEQSNDGGANWFSPALTPDIQYVGPTGTQRYRLQFTIPGGESGAYAIQTQGDIYDNSVNEPAHVFYDAVDQGPVIPIGGPGYFILPIAPGPHVLEIHIGEADGPGLTNPRFFANALDTQCQPATNVTTQEATLHGSADAVPPTRFIRMAYSNTMGGPYTTFGPNVPGDNTEDQQISFTATGLASQAQSGATYYFVTQIVDNDGTTILDESSECSFTTAPYSPRCRVLGTDADSIQIEVCADWVDPGQELQAVWSPTPGGPYNNVGATVAGTNTVGQCIVFDIVQPPCEARYYKARVTPVPGEYVVDWQYAHANRSGIDETAELGLGAQGDWLAAGGESGGFAGLTVVDTHVATGATQGTWTLRSGTDFPVPTGVTQLHLGFEGSGGNGPANGNWLDACSIVLRQVFPVAVNLGEQLINGGFESPTKMILNDWEYIPEVMVPGWNTSDVVGNQNPLNPGAWGGPVINGPIEFFGQNTPVAAYEGLQYAELNAETPSELYQVVDLAVGNADSVQECPAAVFNLECTAATNVDSDSATLNGTECGLAPGQWYAFQYSTSPVGPWNNQTALQQVTQINEPPTPISGSAFPLDQGVDYFYRVVAYDNTQSDVIGVSDPVCSFTTEVCTVWCGICFDPDDCLLVDPGNGDPYFNCNQF